MGMFSLQELFNGDHGIVVTLLVRSGNLFRVFILEEQFSCMAHPNQS